MDLEEEEEEDLGLDKYLFLILNHLFQSSVTIVEKEKFDIQKKTVIVTDKFRTVEKILACENLKDFLAQGMLYFHNQSNSRYFLLKIKYNVFLKRQIYLVQ